MHPAPPAHHLRPHRRSDLQAAETCQHHDRQHSADLSCFNRAEPGHGVVRPGCIAIAALTDSVH